MKKSNTIQYNPETGAVLYDTLQYRHIAVPKPVVSQFKQYCRKHKLPIGKTAAKAMILFMRVAAIRER